VSSAHWEAIATRLSARLALGIVVRTAIGITVVVLLLLRADFPAVARAVREADLRLLTLGTVAFFASLTFSALRWEVFLTALDMQLQRPTLVRLYLVGTFFNAFLPTGFGGDAYKAFVLGRGQSSAAAPLAAGVLDRVAGLAGLALLTLACFPIRLASSDAMLETWTAAALAMALIGGLWVSIARSAEPRPPLEHASASIGSRIRVFLFALRIGLRHPHAMRAGATWGLVTAGLLVAAHGFLLSSIHATVPFDAMPGVVLLASLTTVLPLSINGLGFREATYVWALATFGVTSNVALVFALLVLAVTLSSSAVGGLVYLLGGARLPRGFQDVQHRRNDEEVDPDQQRSDRHEHGGG
jgi:uncharacterized membrane protein YbhN (UPF0104 family)